MIDLKVAIRTYEVLINYHCLQILLISSKIEGQIRNVHASYTNNND